jgi:hypothetical protein
MSNSKISALTSATTPLGGTETLPIVQGGVTVKTTVADITNGGGYAGSFTTLGATGNTTLGDATTDTVRVNGYMGVGGAPAASASIYITSTALTGTTQNGVLSSPTGTSAATSFVAGYTSAPQTAASAFTVTDVIGYRAANATKGASSTITNQHGIYIADQSQGTNNYGITSAVPFAANKWNIYASGLAPNYFAAGVNLGATTNPGAGNLSLTGNVIQGTAAKGFDFSANTPAAGKTSTVLNWYETGTWTPTFTSSAGSFTSITYDAAVTGAKYTRIGNVVYIQGSMRTTAITVGTASGNLLISGLPFAAVANSTGQDGTASGTISQSSAWAVNTPSSIQIASSTITLFHRLTANGASALTQVTDAGTGAAANLIRFSGSYLAA